MPQFGNLSPCEFRAWGNWGQGYASRGVSLPAEAAIPYKICGRPIHSLCSARGCRVHPGYANSMGTHSVTSPEPEFGLSISGENPDSVATISVRTNPCPADAHCLNKNVTFRK